MSKIEVNQISSQCGSTLTIGQSGDTVTLACGATQSGFGRSGSVNWDTTAKTASFTAVSGNGYFVNTTSGAITATLPASPSAGNIVSIADYAGTAATNNITVARNGSNINGDASDLTISNNNSGITLVYVDGTQGWKGTETSNLNDIALQAEYVVATGGTITCCGDYRIHTFTGPGTFTVCSAGNSLGSETVDYLVVAGGASGGYGYGGGGGAGGYRESSGTASGCYSRSPLGACVSALPVTAQDYPITVGAGGAAIGPAPNQAGNSGSSSIFSSITSAGGGGGGAFGGGNAGVPAPAPFVTASLAVPGGSGGGGGTICSGAAPFFEVLDNEGTGNTPPVSPPQGQSGGVGINAYYFASAGGGGAGAVGGNSTGPGATAPEGIGGPGGNGVTTSISATSITYAGGGGGAGFAGTTSGGSGGGGNGAQIGTPSGATSGTTNTGGGGGGGDLGPGKASGAGGSGIVIIRYKYR